MRTESNYFHAHLFSIFHNFLFPPFRELTSVFLKSDFHRTLIIFISVLASKTNSGVLKTWITTFILCLQVFSFSLPSSGRQNFEIRVKLLSEMSSGTLETSERHPHSITCIFKPRPTAYVTILKQR